MRVARLVSLVWTADVVLGLAAVAAADGLIDARRHGAAAPASWPATEPMALVARVSVAGADIAAIGRAPVHGEIPAPPPPPPRPRFSDRVTLLAALDGGGDVRILQLRIDGRVHVLAAGEALELATAEGAEGWRLRALTDESGELRATFRSRSTAAEETLVLPRAAVPDVGSARRRAPRPAGPDEVLPDAPTRQAWFDGASGAWQVPREELRWWQGRGGAAFVERLLVEETARGLRLCDPLPLGPLDDARGFAGGDVVTSVGGVAVRTRDELLAAVRDAARSGRIDVEYERGGVALRATFRLYGGRVTSSRAAGAASRPR